MSTVLLPPGINPIAVDKYIISYHMITGLWAGWFWIWCLILVSMRKFFSYAKHPDNQTCPCVHAVDAKGCLSGGEVVGVWSWTLTAVYC